MDYFKQQLIPFHYVSFDVFDTLIFRTVTNYKSIFDIVALKYKEEYGEFLKTFLSQES